MLVDDIFVDFPRKVLQVIKALGFSIDDIFFPPTRSPYRFGSYSVCVSNNCVSASSLRRLREFCLSERH